MNVNFQKTLLAELRMLFHPIEAALQSDSSRQRLFEKIGWDLDAVGISSDVLTERLTQLVEGYQALDELLETSLDSLDDFLQALDAVSQLYESLHQLRTLISETAIEPLPEFDQIGQDLSEFLTLFYLELAHPRLYDLCVLLTLIQPREAAPEIDPVFNQANDLVRLPQQRSRLRLERLSDLLRNPVQLLKDEYFPSGTPKTAVQSQQVTDRLFPRLANLLNTLGFNSLYSIKPEYGLDFGEAGNSLAAGMLTSSFASKLDNTEWGMTLALSSPEQGDLGLVIAPFGDVSYTHQSGEWIHEVGLNTAIGGFALGPHGLTLPEDVDDSRVGGQFQLFKVVEDNDEPVFLIGSTTGTRLEIGQFFISGKASFQGTERDYGLLVEAGTAALVVSPGDGDGFLQKILPAEGFRVDFDLGLGYSNQRGFYFRGGAGLEARLPIQRSISRLVAVDVVHLALETSEDSLRGSVAATMGTQIGPFNVMIESVGFEINLSFPSTGGNLGAVNIDPAFKPPEGITLGIDSGVLTGSGFLEYDVERGDYEGLVQLKYNTLLLTGIGILNTRRPDGSPGFSLVILITGEFPPVQLGLGFTLNGVGGLLGVNRTANIQALQAGARSGAIASVMFPENPLANAPRILSDLQTFFPQSDGSHLLGPMVKIGWGSSVPILLAEIGIMFEFPDPLRLLLFGQLHLGLPSLEKPITDIHMDIFGSIDFDAGTLAIDAALKDSTIAGYRISGDAALRARWKDNPDFALAIGGFHPRAIPPQNFPALRRVNINLTKTNNPRVRLEGYFALTSNTVQCGARIEAFAKKSKFSAEAFLSFDTLFQFEPFRFMAEMMAGAVVKAFGRTVTTVNLELFLAGPKPWHASGKISFRVIWRYSINFDLTIGDKPDPTPIQPVDLRSLLFAELQRPAAWSGQLPPSTGTAVALRNLRLENNADLLIHPQGRFSVRQTLVPLGIRLDKYGEKPLQGDNTFVIKQVKVNSQVINHTDLQESFAPAQYRILNDMQRLTAPAYEPSNAGITAAPDNTRVGDRVAVEPQYEEIIVDKARGHRNVSTTRTGLANGLLQQVHERSAIARKLRRNNQIVAFPGKQQTIRLKSRV